MCQFSDCRCVHVSCIVSQKSCLRYNEKGQSLKRETWGQSASDLTAGLRGGLTLLYFVEYWLHTEKDEGSNLHCFVVFYSFICSGLCTQDETLCLISSIGRILVVWLLEMQNQNEYSRWKPVLWMIKSPTIQSTVHRFGTRLIHQRCSFVEKKWNFIRSHEIVVPAG